MAYDETWWDMNDHARAAFSIIALTATQDVQV